MAPFDFDSEYDANEEAEDDGQEPESEGAQVTDHADKIVANYLAQHQEDEDEPDDGYMERVDERLEVTTHYRILLQGSLFDSDTPAARIVEKEVRRFVRNRVEVLLGIKREEAVPAPPPVVLPFSESEIVALKTLAAAAMRSSSFSGASEAPKQEPQLRKAQTPVPAPTPTVVRKASKPAPVAKTQPAPPSTPPKAPVPAPIPTTTQTKPPKPGKPGKPGRKRGYIKKEVVNPETGETTVITKVEQQNPADRLPWPSANMFTAMTEAVASRAPMGPAVNIEQPASIASADQTAALIAAALKQP
jgi:hypothetical protein